MAAARAGTANVRFADLCKLVERMGYTRRRQVGSHRIYTRPGMPLINLQRSRGGKAKLYQVDQVLKIIDDNGIEVE